MQLPNGVEWAAHCLVVLERLGWGRPLPSATLAEAYGLSPTYLNKHLQKLAAAALVTSTAGPAGRFALARPAAEISLGDVVDALDGTGPLFRCGEIRCQGLFEDRSAEIKTTGPCRIAAAMRQAEHAWRTSLASISIAELAGGIDADGEQQLTRFIEHKHRGEGRNR